MQDFLDDLEQRLTQVAAQDAPASKPARSPRNFRRRRPAILGGLTAALAAAAAAFTMTGTSLADLPILKTPTKDASALEDDLPKAADAGVDFSKAHVFGTPGGPGYALVNKRTKVMCIVAPDPGLPGDYGQSCAPSIEAVERDGLAVSFVRSATPQRPDGALHIVVLPDDAENVELEVGGRAITPDIESGVVVVSIGSTASLRWSVDGKETARTLVGPFVDRVGRVTCNDGRQVEVESPGGEDSAQKRKRFREAVREACRR